MSIQALAHVIESDIPEVSAKMLLVCIANAHNTSTGMCCPSIDRLAKESGMSRSSVKRWLKWLVEAGHIAIEETHSSNARQLTNTYRLMGIDRGSNLNPLPKVGVQSEPGEGSTSEPPEGSICEPPLKEPEENRNKEPERARATFDEIWNAYPRRRLTNRTEAKSAFDTLADDETWRCLIAARRFHQWHLEDSASRKLEPESQLEFRMGIGKWIRSGAWLEALSVPLKSDPVVAASGLVIIHESSPDFAAIRRLRGKPIVVGKNGTATFTVTELEQARASVGDREGEAAA